jgi:homoserine dehydrogenase
MTTQIRLALLGCGTVGGAVLQALTQPDHPLAHAELVGVAVRDVAAAVARGVPLELLTTDPIALAARPDVDVVIELMGGTDVAGVALATALGRGADVVTANKALIAEDGPRLTAIAARTGATLRFEAAAAASLPVVALLEAAAAGDRVLALRGVLSGTANAVLGALEQGTQFEDAVRAAQTAGYAEADPSRDLDGRDTLDKLVLLARIAFGGSLRAVDAVRTGIEHLTPADADRAALAGRRWKLVATARRSGCLSVEPRQLRADDPLAAAEGAGNVVQIELERGGVLTLSGQGAGGDATASAVLRDLGSLPRFVAARAATLAATLAAPLAAPLTSPLTAA